MSNLSNLSDSDSEFETESSSDGDVVDQTKIMAREYMEVPLIELMKYDTTITDYHSNSPAPQKRIGIIDNNIYDRGTSYDMVYVVSVECVDCSYEFPSNEFKDLPSWPALKACISKLIQSIGLSQTARLVFEQQTLTFYKHYNAQHRLGICIKCVSIADYTDDDSVELFDTRLANWELRSV